MLVNFCLHYIFMNAMRFYLKTTSKIIVLPLLFSTKNLSELFLA